MYVSGRIGKTYVAASAIISAGFIFLILFFLIAQSYPTIRQNGFDLFTAEWNPSSQKFGIVSMLYGTFAVTLIALLVSLPLGVLTAVFTSEILPPRYRFTVKSMLELLAGIPSVVYGLIGVVYLSGWVENFFQLSSGRTIFTAGILLGLMILPSVITLSDDALRHVPQPYREAARSLGFYPYQVIVSGVLPLAKSDIIGAGLLALGRACGETMAVMLVIGSIDKIPVPFYNVLVPGQTVTSKLGREIAESAFGSLHFSSLIFTGFILLLFVLGVTFVALAYFYNPEERLYE